MKLFARASLSQGLLHRTPVPLPPLIEQQLIAEHLEAKCAKFDGLIAKAERIINLLREKRSALITAAVTGRIHVRAAA
jgi:type I restriction enzyme S subunit